MKQLQNCFFLLCLYIFSVPIISAKDADSLKMDRKPGFAAVPDLCFDRSRGFGGGGSVMLMLYLDQKNRQTPASEFSITGDYTSKKDWMAFANARMFFKDDRFRLTLVGGYFNSNFQTYKTVGTDQIEIPYNTHGGIFFIDQAVRVYNRFYVGVSGQYYKSHLTFDDPDFSTENTDSYQNAIGASIMYDSKDDQNFPTKGLLAAFLYKNFPTWLSNDSAFNKLDLFANYYYSLRYDMVLASRLALNTAVGNNVPFVAQSYVGNKDIRGYSKGEYRGNQTYAIQSEFRWNFYKKWGAVGFFGLAIAHSPGYTSPLLPGGGVGLRYKILPRYKMNIGVDAALGKNDWGLYFRIGEAF